MVYKKRKGETLIELLIATLILAMFLPLLFGFTNIFRVIGSEEMQRLTNINTLFEIKNVIEEEWNSAQRMQSGEVSDPSSVSSISFKKTYKILGSSETFWAKYNIDTTLKRNDTAILPSSYSVAGTPLLRFYGIDGKLLASNQDIVEIDQGKNTAYTPYYRIFILIKGYPIDLFFSAIRNVSPDWEAPTVTTFTPPYKYNQAMDTTKQGTWTDVLTSSSKPDATYSSFSGIHFKNPAVFDSIVWNFVSFQARLYDPLNNMGVAGKTVKYKLKDILGLTKEGTAVTGADGKITISTFSIISSYELNFDGDDDYVKAKVP